MFECIPCGVGKCSPSFLQANVEKFGIRYSYTARGGFTLCIGMSLNFCLVNKAHAESVACMVGYRGAIGLWCRLAAIVSAGRLCPGTIVCSIIDHLVSD